MVTIYDLLSVDEKATKEEIENAYHAIILKYRIDPNESEEKNKQNEMILSKLKMAYEILTTDEKRARYDNDLAKKRAEELINNVVVSKESENVSNENEEVEPEKQVENTTTNEAQEENEVSNSVEEADEEDEEEETEVELTKEEQKRIQKAAKKEFDEKLKKVQKAEEEYNQAYQKAYNDYLRKNGYKVKEPWTLKRVKNLVITLLVIFFVCAMIWIIPPTRNMLIDIYKSNFMVKALVDIFVALVKAVFSIFK